MGELTDKIKGNVNEAIGKAKQAVADHDRPRSAAEADRDAELKAEGVGQEGKGKAQQFAGKVKGALGDDI
ncbi:CsbD family protein [Sphingomonas sp.]|uniref:CsbD family protein n=1 Tax=Sphingomonas sp. TaxID=28214 RepID=UPI0035C7DF06